MSDTTAEPVGIVVIGRNEGERLRRCLDSVGDATRAVVYVDSGSTDGSLEHVRSRGIESHALDLSRPFTAGRARNAGAEQLLEHQPGLDFIQFIDGDCELAPGWLEHAQQAIAALPDTAAVAGRVRERHPDASIYNRLCDMEWYAPSGEAKSVGGIALFRVAAFRAAGGFDPELIAGEEPELCLRLRRAGWSIHCLEREMARHDAEMTRFGQWWRRTARAGYAYAQGRAMHGASPERYCVDQVRSILEWSALLPAVALVLAWPTWGVSLLLLLLLYPVQIHRIRRRRIADGELPADAGLYARYCVLGKFPQLLGAMRYWLNRVRGRRSEIMEYKQVPPAADGQGAGS